MVSLALSLFLSSKKEDLPSVTFCSCIYEWAIASGRRFRRHALRSPRLMCPMPSGAKHICRPNDTRRIWISGPVCFWSAKILLCGAFSGAITWSVHKKFRGWGLRQPRIVWPQTFHSCRLDRDLNLMTIWFIYLFIIDSRWPLIVVISGLLHRGRKKKAEIKQICRRIFSLNFYCARRSGHSKRFVCVRAWTATLSIYELWAEDEGLTTRRGVTAIGQNEETTPFATP